MGTFDYDTLWTTEGIGWVWSPRVYYVYETVEDKNLLEALVKAKLLRPGQKGSRDAHDIQVPWLEYHVRQLSKTLRPVDPYYRAPRLQDAIGYHPPSDNDNYDSESEWASSK